MIKIYHDQAHLEAVIAHHFLPRMISVLRQRPPNAEARHLLADAHHAPWEYTSQNETPTSFLPEKRLLIMPLA